jgi:hypothetical protein
MPPPGQTGIQSMRGAADRSNRRKLVRFASAVGAVKSQALLAAPGLVSVTPELRKAATNIRPGGQTSALRERHHYSMFCVGRSPSVCLWKIRLARKASKPVWGKFSHVSDK